MTVSTCSMWAAPRPPTPHASRDRQMRSGCRREVLPLVRRHPEVEVTLAHVSLHTRQRQRLGKRQDPCVLDTFMAATDFMRGAAAAPWWSYTAQRKLLYGQIESH